MFQGKFQIRVAGCRARIQTFFVPYSVGECYATISRYPSVTVMPLNIADGSDLPLLVVAAGCILESSRTSFICIV